ncbi:MAG: competence/damage-inducible protein A [Candidatus Coatesbacteria bacterium]|nr:competence/damage-inducible protein A [Candidatus Coatesbacteria bacterium]
MTSRTDAPRSAGIVIIGNEILCGRTRDTNSHWLSNRLHDLGIQVRCIITIPDEEDQIIRTVREFSNQHDYVLVTGGIGPTPDDVTRQAVAMAFDTELATDPDAERVMRERYRDRINSYRLEMARIPRGSTLIRNKSFAAPGFQIKNVYVFPGVPQLLAEMFDQIIPSLETGEFFERRIPAHIPESEFAQILFSTPQPLGISIGSYPTMHEDGSWTVAIIVSGNDALAVDETAGGIEHQLRELERSKGIDESNR